MLSDQASTDADRPADRSAAIARSPWIVPAVGALIALATWELLPLSVGAGLDPSSVNGVNLGARLGLAQGTELAWTYGPLGFLQQPSVAGEWTATLGVLYTALVRLALATTLLWAARRSFGLVAGAALTYFVCAITPAEAVPISIAVVCCIVALDPERPERVPSLLALGGGAFAALVLLVKLNIGIEVLALIAIAVIAIPGRRLRAVAQLGAAFAVTAIVLWLASGQRLGDLDDFARAAYEVVSGYSVAMGTEVGAVEWDWVAAAAMIATALGGTAWTTRGQPRATRVGSLLMIAALCLITIKQGFVRHDEGHILTLVATLAAPLLALRWVGGERLAAAAAIVGFSLLAAPLTGRAERDVYRPVAAAGDAFDQLRVGLDPGRRAELADAAAAAARAEYAIDPRTLAALEGGGVAVDPWEASAAWAYDLEWDPLPVFQSYGAYTPELDRLNADALAAADGPDLVLRHLPPSGVATDSIDGRYAPFDEPAVTREMLCRFRAVRTTDRYQVLARRADRCGPEVEVETVAGSYNEPIEVPPVGRDELLFARIDGLEPSGLGRLRTLFYKDIRRLIALDERVYRLVGPNAADGLLISAPPGVDFPSPFALAPNPAAIALGKDGGFGSGPDSFEVEFFKVPVKR